MTEQLKEPRTTWPTRLLRGLEVESRTGLACSTIYLRMAERRVPRPTPLGEQAVGWVKPEIDEWIRMRVSTGRAAERPSSTNHHRKDREQ